MKKLKLLNSFLDKYIFINKRIFDYSILSLENEFSPEKFILRNPTIYCEDDEPLYMGALEIDYCIMFWKRTRKILYHDFFKYNGRFSVTLEITSSAGIQQRLIEHELESKFEFSKEYCGNVVVYTIH